MPSASFAAVYAAGQRRLAEIGQQLLVLLDNNQDTRDLVRAGLDLALGLEACAAEPSATERERLQGYLIHTYGLLAYARDPWNHPEAPAIPANGAIIVKPVLVINGAIVVINGALISTGAELAPSS